MTEAANFITITYDNDQTLELPVGSSLSEICAHIPRRYPRPLAAEVNNVLHEMDYKLFSDSTIIWRDYTTAAGFRIYSRSVIFLLMAACKRLYPNCDINVCHSLENGFFCRLIGGGQLESSIIISLQDEMKKIVKEDLPIACQVVTKQDAVAYFLSQGKETKANLISCRKSETLRLYTLEGITEYFFGRMARRTGVLTHFSLSPFSDGFILALPVLKEMGPMAGKFDEDRNLAAALKEYRIFREAIGVETFGKLNQIINSGGLRELGLIDEARQERALHFISDMIAKDFPSVRVVMIAGPSSSGKTTFTKRLCIQFRLLGLQPVSISLDDYFIDREHTPLDEQGNRNYENIEALDINLFSQHLNSLLKREEVCIPRYNFLTGKRDEQGVPCCLGEDKIVVIEGIHALNKRLTEQIPQDCIRYIYVSALSQMKLDRYSIVASTDIRLMRRIIRDNQFRGQSAENTIMLWQAVRRGETKNIFPYQGNADFYFDSALVYEMPVIKQIIEPLLSQITTASPAYLEARRLLNLLQYVCSASTDDVLTNSILQEFLGHSFFSY